MNQTQAIIVGAALTFLILAVIGYMTEKKGSKCGACSGGCTCGKCAGCLARRERFSMGHNTDVPRSVTNSRGDEENETFDDAFTRSFVVTNHRA